MYPTSTSYKKLGSSCSRGDTNHGQGVWGGQIRVINQQEQVVMEVWVHKLLLESGCLPRKIWTVLICISQVSSRIAYVAKIDMKLVGSYGAHNIHSRTSFLSVDLVQPHDFWDNVIKGIGSCHYGFLVRKGRLLLFGSATDCGHCDSQYCCLWWV